MKRKSGKKSRQEAPSNGVEEAENDDISIAEDENGTPKKRKKWHQKGESASKKSDDSGSEGNSDASSASDNDKEKKKISLKKIKRLSKLSAEKDSEDENSEPAEKMKKPPKKNRKPVEAEQESEEVDDDTQYEVEKIVDVKTVRGAKMYLIRWKGYEEESDTWEREDTLNCQDLIKEFNEKKKKEKTGKKGRKKKAIVEVPDWDENEDFEVDRVIDVRFKRDGKREFLVSWKGYSKSENTWEPEENMDCKDLIKKFMSKLEKRKEVEEKDLRVNRRQVQRYTLHPQAKDRRMSKRNREKERVQYHDAE